MTAVEVPHKGGRTFGYRVEADGVSLAYLPDHHPAPDKGSSLALARDVDVLLHGAMFTDDERAVADAYGHATIGDARLLADAAGVGTLVLTHHAPSKTDSRIEGPAATLADARTSCVVGREGDVVLDARRPHGH